MTRMASVTIEQTDGAVVFTARIVPGSSRTSPAGVLDGMVKIKISVPPEKGKANQALIEFLAKKIGVKKKDISIIAGLTSKVKRIKIEGVGPEVLRKKLST